MFNLLKRSDARQVRQVLSGHSEAFGPLVERYLPAVYAVSYAYLGNHADAEDVTQEAFVSAYTSLHTLKEPKKFEGWVVSIARQTAAKLRRKQRREATTTAALPPGTIHQPDPGREELRRLLRAEIERMDDEPREVLLLHYHAGMNAREIAAALDINREAVKKRLQRARQTLSESLLAVVGEEATPKTDYGRQREAIMGLVAAAGVGWGPGAAAGGGQLLASAGSGKLIALATVVTLVVWGSVNLALSSRAVKAVPEVETSVVPVVPDLAPVELTPDVGAPLPGNPYEAAASLSSLPSGTESGIFKDEESRLLMERILQAHAEQSAALSKYEFTAQWETRASGAGGSVSEMSGTVRRIHQDDQCYFMFTSEQSGPRGEIYQEMETVGVLNGEYFAAWGIDNATGIYTSPKWFEMPENGRFPQIAWALSCGLDKIRPLRQAMGHGGNPLTSLVDSYPKGKILFTCREEATARGGQRIRVTIERTAVERAGLWATLLLNPAKGYMVEESVVFGEDGSEFTRNVKLSEVRDGIWFPREIVLKTTVATAETHIRSEHFRLLNFKLGGTHPDDLFTLDALDPPQFLLEEYGVARFYLDGRFEVTTLDGRDHLEVQIANSLTWENRDGVWTPVSKYPGDTGVQAPSD